MLKNPVILIVSFIVLWSCSSKKTVDKTTIPTKKTETLSEDGAWCWFSDPRAIYYSDTSIVTGWVKKDGSVEIASLNLETGEKEFNSLYPQFEIDDHDNPAFAILPNGNIFTAFAWHSTEKGIVFNTTTNGSDVKSFGENVVFKPKTDELLRKFPRETYTYANPYVLTEENNKLLVFGRWIGYKPNMIVSLDNGLNWSEQYVLMSDQPFTPGNRPYVKYFSDGKSKVHLLFTDGHPRNEPLNSVYYCYYEKGAFWKVDGSKICDVSGLPFHVSDASVVYKATDENGRAWIADIAVKNNQPVILYSRHPEENDHRYRYAWYNFETALWEDHEICKAGKWFPQTQEGKEEREPHYMGNLTLQPSDLNVVYLSKQVNERFEIYKYQTKDGGKNWESTAITENSEYDQVRPYVPRNQSEQAKTVVMWMENKKYIHYTNYDTGIKYFVDKKD